MICPPCLGTGLLAGIICPVCQGRAELPDTRRKNSLCSPCLGTGLSRITPGHLCEICGGWGTLPDKAAIEGPKVISVHAGKVWDTHIELATLFKELQGELCVCDPYYGTGSLLRLSGLTHCREIRFLTQRADSGEQSILGRALKEFTTQHAHVQFRQCASKDLHDRYLLTETDLVFLGHGLKDVGSKDSFVIRLDTSICKDVVKTVNESFNEKWRLAKPLP